MGADNVAARAVKRAGAGYAARPQRNLGASKALPATAYRRFSRVLKASICASTDAGRATGAPALAAALAARRVVVNAAVAPAALPPAAITASAFAVVQPAVGNEDGLVPRPLPAAAAAGAGPAGAGMLLDAGAAIVVRRRRLRRAAR